MIQGGQCGLCAYWEQKEQGHFGECKMGEVNRETPFHPESLAVAHDSSSILATLRTHRVFGCTQFVQVTLT